MSLRSDCSRDFSELQDFEHQSLAAWISGKTVEVFTIGAQGTVRGNKSDSSGRADSGHSQPGPLRILYVIEAMQGGARRHILQLLTHLDSKCFRPALVCSTRRDPSAESDILRLREAGIPITVIPMRREIYPLADATAYVQLTRHLRANRYDIVHTHCAKAGVLGRLAARRARVPVIIHTPHLLPFQWTRGARRQVYLAVERCAAKWTDRIIVLTEGQKRLAIEAGLCGEQSLSVVPNGIALWQYDRSAERLRKRRALGIDGSTPLVGTVARLVHQKGLEYFLQAARTVRQHLSPSRFLIVGEGPLEYSLRSLAARLGLGEACFWIPHQAKIEAIYCALDVFVLSSLWEGLPYALLEAMGAQCPIVATSIPGPTDVLIDGSSALFAPPANSDAFAEKIIETLRDPAAAAARARHARTLLERFYTLERFLQRTQALYIELAARKLPDADA